MTGLPSRQVENRLEPDSEDAMLDNMKRLWILLGLLVPVATMAQQGTGTTAGEEREVEITPGVNMKLCWCPPGTFTMGDGEDRHQVTLTKGFWIGKTEVTQAQWQAVMGSNPSQFTGPQNPVESVSWNDVQAFLTKVGSVYRLPTDAQWEYACRAGSAMYFCFGDDEAQLEEYAWHEGNSAGTTHPVGQKKPNAWGLHDLHGNVLEWCQDGYESHLGRNPVTDPASPSSGPDRVCRGGSCFDLARSCTSASRYSGNADRRSNHWGFRIAADSFPSSPGSGGGAVSVPGTAASAAASAASSASAAASSTAVVVPLPGPPLGHPWTNSLGMKFVPVPGTSVLFSVWDTRVQDYQAFVTATGRSWAKPEAPKAVDNEALGPFFERIREERRTPTADERKYIVYQGLMVPARQRGENPVFEQGPTHPAVMVSWDDAKAFCVWLTEKERRGGMIDSAQEYRLPTDLEWSAAVGLPPEPGSTPKERDGKIENIYPWGTQWPPPRGAGNYTPAIGVDDFTFTSPVGSFAANRFGLYDMGGNVYQWCEDFYDGQGGDRVARGSSFFSPEILGAFSEDWWQRLQELRNSPADRYRRSMFSSHRSPRIPGKGDIIHGETNGFRVVLAGRVPSPPAQAVAASAAASAASAAAASATVVVPLPGFQPGQPWTNSLGMPFVPVPGTSLLFSVWDTRVQDYQAFAAATGRPWTKPDFAQEQTHPVVKVTWDDAKAFCAWLTQKERSAGTIGSTHEYRLSTDEEWSAAVGLPLERGSTPKERDGKVRDVYPWGTRWPPPHGAGNYSPDLQVDEFDVTSPVGSFAANRFGLFDMAGNVCQWCEDLYDPGATAHVLRGASYASSYDLSSKRTSSDATRDEYGFRVVLVGAVAAVAPEQPGGFWQWLFRWRSGGKR